MISRFDDEVTRKPVELKHSGFAIAETSDVCLTPAHDEAFCAIRYQITDLYQIQSRCPISDQRNGGYFTTRRSGTDRGQPSQQVERRHHGERRLPGLRLA